MGDRAIVVEEEVGVGIVEVPSVVGGACNEGLYEINAEKANEGGDEEDNGGDFREGDNVERGGVSDLVTPAVEEVVSDGKGE